MTLTLRRNGSSSPGIVTDFFDDDFFITSNLLDLDGSTSSRLRRGIPSVNIIENTNNFLLELAAPGMEKNDFKVQVDNGVLTISSKKENEEKEEGKNYSRQEFSYNSFSRSFSLPENCIVEKIVAVYENGILALTLPKGQVSISKPKEIKVS